MRFLLGHLSRIARLTVRVGPRKASCLLFESDGEFYDYGFSAVLAERSVSSEWLYRLELGRGKRWAQQVILIATVPMLRRWVRVSRSVPMSAIGLTYTRRTSPERRIVFS